MNGHRLSRGNRGEEQNPAYGLLRPYFFMTDQELWNAAVRQIVQAWRSYAPSLTERLTGLLHQVGACKESLHALATAGGGDRHCVSCRGACCFGGKHHVTIIDLLAHLALGVELFTPRFGAPVCPYAGPDGCLMVPRLRPRTCIVFLCDAVQEGMGGEQLTAVVRLERELELLYRDIGNLLAIPPARSLLLAVESSASQGVPVIPAAAEIKE